MNSLIVRLAALSAAVMLVVVGIVSAVRLAWEGVKCVM